jgi:hypothetical protein
MNGCRLFKCVAFFLLLVYCAPQPAMAYIGPGTGISAVGVFVAVVMGVVLALFGFVWYPAKRLLRAGKKRFAANQTEQTA